MLKQIKRLALGVVVGLLALAGLIAALIPTLGNREVLYEGKSALYWAEQCSTGDAAASNRAFAVLSARIIPKLPETMLYDTNDSWIRVKLVDVLNDLPGIRINFTPAVGRRAGTVNSVGLFGPAAKGAIPLLIQGVKGHDAPVRNAAAAALGDIHSEPEVVIPILIACLDDNDLNDEAAEALGKFGALAKAAVPRLIPMLKIPDRDVHEAVVGALKKIDPEAAAAAGVK